MKNDEIIKAKITFIVNYYPKHWNKLSKILETGLLIKLRKSNKTTTTIYFRNLFISINSNPKYSFVHKKLTKRTVVRYLYLNLVKFNKIIVCNYDVKFLENIFGLLDNSMGDIGYRKLISTLDLKPKDLIINWSWKRIDSSNDFWNKKDINGRILFFTEFPKFIEFAEKEGALVEKFYCPNPLKALYMMNK